MKSIFLFAFVAVLLVSINASVEDSNELDVPKEQSIEEFQDFAPINANFTNFLGAFSDSNGPEPYRRCVAVRCPIRCFICICRCIRYR